MKKFLLGAILAIAFAVSAPKSAQADPATCCGLPMPVQAPNCHVVWIAPHGVWIPYIYCD